MYYILTTNHKGFIKILDNNEIIVSPNCDKATQYLTIGEAIKQASIVNSMLGTCSVKVISIG